MAVTAITKWILNAGSGGGSSPTGTSGSFTPADNSLIVLLIFCDTGAGTTPGATISGGGLTWTQRVVRGDSEGTAGIVFIYTAPVTTGSSMTVQVTVNSIGATNNDRGYAKAYVVDNPDPSPIGNVAENSSTTNNLTASGLTTTQANSYVFYVGEDWNALGSPTSSDLTNDPAHIASTISGIFGYKSAVSAGAVTANLDAAGAGAADWNWGALEVKTAAGGGGGAIPRGVFGKMLTGPFGGAI